MTACRSITHRHLTLLGGALALSACAATGGSDAPPPAFSDYAVSVRQAQFLAEACPDVAIDNGAVGQGAQTLGRTLGAQGYGPADIAGFQETLDTDAIEADIAQWVAANNLRDGGPEVACTLAEREIIDGSQIGAFLQDS